MDAEYKMTNAEYRLCEIIWDNEPVASPELCRLCEEKLGWKRTTTYTVLKKLCDRGVMRNESATVTSVIPREQAQRFESRAVMEKAFGGSLPMFVAAFLSGRTLSDEEAEQLKALIERHREG
jgi:BlaI family penicillinase repressor